MKSPVLIALSILIMLEYSCKKSNDQPEPGNPASSRIKTMTLTDTTGLDTIGLFYYQYDAQGRISQMISKTSPVSMAFIHNYAYYPSSVFDNISFSQNTHWGRTIYELNPAGLAVTELHVAYGMPGDSAINLTVANKYDTGGFRIEENSRLRSDTIIYGWQIMNGNSISLEVRNSLHVGELLRETYEHYQNTVNTLGNSNMGMMFMGKSNINLIKSSAILSAPPQTANYSYLFDSSNRVIKQYVRGNGLTSGSYNLAVTYY